MGKPVRIMVTLCCAEDCAECGAEQSCDEEISFPGKREVCPTCDGSGKHVDPSIDGHGISAEEWDRDWDDEEREGYFRGDYDVICEQCGGANVVDVIDYERAAEEMPAELKRLEEHEQSLAEMYACERAERAMGA